MIWLVIGLLFAQGPSLALAACCADEYSAGEASCCCEEITCTAPSPDDAQSRLVVDESGCGCLEAPAPLPAQTPAAPAERAETGVRLVQPIIASACLPPLATNDQHLHGFFRPPDSAPLTLATIRTVVLLI